MRNDPLHVMSQLDKLYDIDVKEQADGSIKITHKWAMQDPNLHKRAAKSPHAKPNQEKLAPRTFDSMEQFAKWIKNRLSDRQHRMQQKLTPHQFWVTQLANTERPFTNEYWWYNDVGHYTCRVCTQNLFLYEHKYKNRSGMPTFWNSLSQAIRFENDKLEMPEVTNAQQCPTLQNKVPIKRACCSNVSD